MSALCRTANGQRSPSFIQSSQARSSTTSLATSAPMKIELDVGHDYFEFY